MIMIFEYSVGFSSSSEGMCTLATPRYHPNPGPDPLGPDHSPVTCTSPREGHPRATTGYQHHRISQTSEFPGCTHKFKVPPGHEQVRCRGTVGKMSKTSVAL